MMPAFSAFSAWDHGKVTITSLLRVAKEKRVIWFLTHCYVSEMLQDTTGDVSLRVWVTGWCRKKKR